MELALNFWVQPQSVFIAMDTLSVDAKSKRPHLYCSKIFLLPHLEAALCGTGAFALIMDWYVTIQLRVLAKDVLVLDQFAPSLLSEIAAKYDLNDELTTTVYHFSYSQEIGEYRAFAYRSTKGFQSEPIVHDLGIKPAVEPEPFDKLPDGFIQLVHRQRQLDRAAPVADQIGIGGEIQFLMMTPGLFQLSNCYRYDDYEDQYNQMLQNLSQP